MRTPLSNFLGTGLIIDLQDVLDALKKQSFTTSNLRQLCLRLGLSYNTLTSIESDHRMVERQLEEGISHWLRVKYDNKKYAMPSIVASTG